MNMLIIISQGLLMAIGAAYIASSFMEFNLNESISE
jgi:hypothetical protein